MKSSRLAHLNSCQILNYFTCDKQTCNSRYKGCAAWDITALSAFVLCSRRTYTMTAAAYGHILKRTYGLFVGVDYFQLPDAALSQLVTHYTGKGTD